MDQGQEQMRKITKAHYSEKRKEKDNGEFS